MSHICTTVPADRAVVPALPDRQWRPTFLDALAETSNVTEAATKAGIAASTAYRARREDEVFADEWQAALVEGYTHLEMETLHRLRMGVDAGKDERKFDIANALRLLSLHKRAVAEARALDDEEEDEETIRASLNAKIDAMRAREAEINALLAADDYDD